MGFFSSETSANRDNSGKFETLIALQNDLRWLLLHSWFFKILSGEAPRTTLQEEIHEKILDHSFSQPMRHAATPSQTDTKQKRCYLLGI